MRLQIVVPRIGTGSFLLTSGKAVGFGRSSGCKMADADIQARRPSDCDIESELAMTPLLRGGRVRRRFALVLR
jgi:hypothetical protein